MYTGFVRPTHYLGFATGNTTRLCVSDLKISWLDLHLVHSLKKALLQTEQFTTSGILLTALHKTIMCSVHCTVGVAKIF